MKLTKNLVVLACLLGLSALLQAQQTCNASIPAATPTADFTDNGDGTVTHSRTGLMWKRCAEGQTWSGSTCTGSASTFTWSNALLAGRNAATANHGDWRLPNIKELESIVESKCYSRSINASIFPNTFASSFWSASAYAYFSDSAWVVDFNYGLAAYGSKYNAHQIRLVRPGQSFGAFDSYDTVPLTVSKTGAGSVNGGSVNCGSTCIGNAGRGFDVTLSATPAVNLIAWGGACASAGAAPTCTVTMDAAKTVSASFLDTPLISGLPGTLMFALQNIGTTSSAQHATLTNSGTAALTGLNIAATGDYAQSHNCGTGLSVGSFCTLNITFTPTAAGTRNGAITITSNATGSPHSVTLSGAAASSTRLVNLSTRGQVQTGNNVMIGGFIVDGATPKKVLIRAVGPNLANYGITGVVANPMLELHRSSDGSIIASNNDWGSATNFAEIQATGLAPVSSLESAILITLPPGAYTAIVSGADGGSGVGIVEVYDIDHPESPLINASTRGQVQTGSNVMIGGFIIQGTSNQPVLIRAVGPNLTNYGVTGVLADPMLELHRSSDGAVVASNDDWQTASNAAAIQATGLAPVSPLESAILITLPPGAYTAIVSGSGGGTGVGIVELYAQ